MAETLMSLQVCRYFQPVVICFCASFARLLVPLPDFLQDFICVHHTIDILE